ncbi:DoxX family protein [Microbaculum marinisediminis]|uniref:DoxX family protein n=1 Tax=Microbaculum marinisediminis TaxID=2931392 RepID=A0AAW5QZF9_9HYPH|nr:DoxX family protein [Microbaculum sp. A6E488]MCT8971645.1 DoxX family protein [Microbaculum sp. A6E488]
MAFDHWLKGPAMRWAVMPVQLGLRAWVFFMLPFVNSGLTKWETFPFLKPEAWAWNGWPSLSGGATYQFSNSCSFCFNIRIWGSEQSPLVQWVFPFPETMAALAGVGEIVLPVLILIGLLTRLSALGLLTMTIVIQLVLPTGWPVHATWAALLLGIVALGPGLFSFDALFGRFARR